VSHDESVHGAAEAGSGSQLADAQVSPSSGLAKLYRTVAVVGVGALALSFYGAEVEPERFGYSYLFAFFVVLSVAVGALFFVLVQHLTSSTWSITVRRAAELLMRGMPVFLVLVVPVLVFTHRLYPWDGAARETEPMQAGAFANANDEGFREPAALVAANREITAELAQARSAEDGRVLAGRRVYMNRPFFTLRALTYLGIWSFMAWRLFSWSTRQDEERTARATLLSQRFAPAATIVLAITLVLASVDWLMSLEPLWTSTIFGVYIFAGCAVAHSAVLILFVLLLQRSGHLREAVSTEHYHDMAKLLFGWMCFWAYIAFVQFFLIWYANVPEEVSFFHRRWTDNLGTWQPMSTSLFLLHFLVPFWMLLSRNAKRRPTFIAIGAVLILALHAVDIYWLILPHFGLFAPHWLDLTCLVGVGCIYAAAVLRAIGAHPLVPVGDPRLSRSLSFENA
jgi:hypothetical protein